MVHYFLVASAMYYQELPQLISNKVKQWWILFVVNYPGICYYACAYYDYVSYLQVSRWCGLISYQQYNMGKLASLGHHIKEYAPLDSFGLLITASIASLFSLSTVHRSSCRFSVLDDQHLHLVVWSQTLPFQQYLGPDYISTDDFNAWPVAFY